MDIRHRRMRVLKLLTAFASISALLAGPAQARRTVVDGVAMTSFTPDTFGQKSDTSLDVGFNLGANQTVTVYDNGLIVIGDPLTSFPSQPGQLQDYGRDVLSPALGNVDAGSFQYGFSQPNQANLPDPVPDGDSFGDLFRVQYTVDSGIPVVVNFIQVTTPSGDFAVEFSQGSPTNDTTLPSSTVIGYDIGGNLVSQNAINTDDADELYLINPNVSAAPEPSTWVLLLSGVGLIGATLRFARRSTKGVLSA